MTTPFLVVAGKENQRNGVFFGGGHTSVQSAATGEKMVGTEPLAVTDALCPVLPARSLDSGDIPLNWGFSKVRLIIIKPHFHF